MPLTYGIARAFINHAREKQPDLLSEDEEKLLLIAAISHDWAESITSDISLGDKTVADEEDERAAFEENLASFYKGDDFELVDQARREIVFDHSSKLGELLNAIERIGYLRTALRANQVINQGVSDVYLDAGLKWLVFDVMSNLQDKDDPEQIPKLLELRKFNPVAAYLQSVEERTRGAFDCALENMESILPKYKERASQKREQMKNSVQNWDRHWELAAQHSRSNYIKLPVK